MLTKGLLSAGFMVLSLAAANPAACAEDSDSASSQPAAQITTSYSPVDFTSPNLTEPVLMDQAPAAAAAPAASSQPPQGAIMAGLDAIGIGHVLEDLNITISGYGEIGYFYDMTSPNNTSPARRDPTLILFPGDYKNDFILDQVDLQIARPVDNTKWDIGFTIEGMYGRDTVYIHSDGILDNGVKHANTSPDDDLDLPQAYLLFNIPVGNGLTITAGKFYTLLGLEQVNPTQNAFYTHSYIFSWGLPFTQTGILAAYNLSNELKLTAGITRGWNQSTDDNNGAIDFLGQIAWTVSSAFNLDLTLSEGPQSTNDNHDYWTVVDGNINYQLSDQLSIAADLLYGNANAMAQWYGAAGYVKYKLGDIAALNLRAEYYHDGRGFTTGVATTDVNYFEGTFGVAITPTSNVPLLQSLTFRPEIRVDTADQPVYDGRKYTQFTAAVDAYLKF